jgi:hypothetical protein
MKIPSGHIFKELITIIYEKQKVRSRSRSSSTV